MFLVEDSDYGATVPVTERVDTRRDTSKEGIRIMSGEQQHASRLPGLSLYTRMDEVAMEERSSQGSVSPESPREYSVAAMRGRRAASHMGRSAVRTPERARSATPTRTRTVRVAAG